MHFKEAVRYNNILLLCYVTRCRYGNGFKTVPSASIWLRIGIGTLWYYLFIYLFIYLFKKKTEFEEMGTTYIYNDTDNIINLMNT